MRSLATAYDAPDDAERKERGAPQTSPPRAAGERAQAVTRFLETHSELEIVLAATLGIAIELKRRHKGTGSSNGLGALSTSSDTRLTAATSLSHPRRVT
jgi:hypothetical protein